MYVIVIKITFLELFTMLSHLIALYHCILVLTSLSFLFFLSLSVCTNDGTPQKLKMGREKDSGTLFISFHRYLPSRVANEHFLLDIHMNSSFPIPHSIYGI